MLNKKEKTANSIIKAISYLFLILAFFVLIIKTVALGEKFYYSNGVLFAVLISFVILVFLFLLAFFGSTVISTLKKFIGKLSVKKMFLIILIGSFTVHALYMLIFPIDSSIHPDIYVYVNTIKQLVESGAVVENANYLATYPHMFATAICFFLPAVIFGANVTAFNAFISLLYIGAAVLLFDTIRYVANKNVAFITAILFVLVPTQLFLSQFLVHENFMVITTVIAFWLVFRVIPSVDKLYKKILLTVPLGVIIAFCTRVNAFAVFLYLVIGVYALVKLLRCYSHRRLIAYASACAISIVSFVLITLGFSAVMKNSLPEVASADTLPFGWSLYLGINYETSGAWNQKDVDVYYHVEEGWTNDDIKNYQKTLIKNRLGELFSSPDRLIKLLFNKFKTSWGNWEYPVGYANECISSDGAKTFYNKVVYKPLVVINELIFIGCAFMLVVSARPRELNGGYESACKLLLIFVALVLLAVESNAKYSMFIPSVFILLAALCYKNFFTVSENFKSNVRKLLSKKTNADHTKNDGLNINTDNKNS